MSHVTRVNLSRVTLVSMSHVTHWCGSVCDIIIRVECAICECFCYMLVCEHVSLVLYMSASVPLLYVECARGSAYDCFCYILVCERISLVLYMSAFVPFIYVECARGSTYDKTGLLSHFIWVMSHVNASFYTSIVPCMSPTLHIHYLNSYADV